MHKHGNKRVVHGVYSALSILPLKLAHVAPECRITSTHIRCRNVTLCDLICNKMTVNLNVFSTFMKDGVCSNVRSCLAVTKQLHGFTMRQTEKCKQSFQPFESAARGGHRPIFSLSGRSRNNVLLLCLLGNW